MGFISYQNLTFGRSDKLGRWIQNTRLHHALRAIDVEGKAVLDFGAGNGHLFKVLLEGGARPAQTHLYEPSWLMDEAKNHLAAFPQVQFFSRASEMSGPYDVIFCMEVFEHLTPHSTLEALADLRRLLSPRGKLVLGVPNEIYFMALAKGLYRSARAPREFDGRLRHVFAATLGHPPKERPLSQLSEGLPYYFHHLGFDFRQLRTELDKHFEIQKIFGSPFPQLPLSLNSEIYFILTRRL